MEETEVKSPYESYEEDIEESGALDADFTNEPEKKIKGRRELTRVEKEERKQKRSERGKTFMKYGKKALTLGGAIKVTNKHLYVPTNSGQGVKDARKITRSGIDSLKSLREASMPSSSSMRDLTRPKYPQRGKTERPKMDFSKMRTLTSPKLTKLQETLVPSGLTPSEKAAYKEIKMNHDVDTQEHVVEELMKLGVSKRSANSAIRSLIKKRTVKKDTSLKGEPILVVVR